VIAAVVTSGDAGNVATTRTWILAAVGVLLIVSAGAGSLLLRHHNNVRPPDSSPFPVGQAFTTRQWSQVKKLLVARGFDGAAARVVSGLRLQRNNEPSALVRATSPSRGVCFLPVRGLQPGAATCRSDGRLPTPLLVFSARDRWGNRSATALVGVARHAITSVSITDPRGVPAGVALIPAGGGLWSFAGGFGNTTKLVVQARAASARVVAQTTLR